MAGQQGSDVNRSRTGDLLSELRRRAATAALRGLHRVITPFDSITFVLTAVIGAGADAFWFAGGLSTPVVSLLSGLGGMTTWKLLKNTKWQKKKCLKMIKEFKDEGLITESEAEEWRRTLVIQYSTMDHSTEDK